MASIKAIKTRIRSIKNTAQITKAMEVVSATKMRKSQGFALSARPYAVSALEMLQNIVLRAPLLPPLLREREIKTAGLLVVTSDKGLAGGFNANVLKRAEDWIAEKKAARCVYRIVTVGKKARDYFLRRAEPVAESYADHGDFVLLEETMPLADLAMRGFLAGDWDALDAVYTNFRTTLLQEVTLRRILPTDATRLEEAVAGILPERGRYAESLASQNHPQSTRYHYEYMFEPSAEEILASLVPQLIRVHVHHIILESNASEHSARMVAMKNASDNARELIGDLTLSYNKARQANITRELTEITAGREALEQ